MCPIVMTGQKLQTEFVIFLRHVYYSIFSFDSLIYKILCKLLIGNTIWLVENYEVDFDTLMYVNTVCLMYWLRNWTPRRTGKETSSNVSSPVSLDTQSVQILSQSEHAIHFIHCAQYSKLKDSKATRRQLVVICCLFTANGH